MLDRMDIDVWEVIEAAASKPFGFVPFYPSPGVGGDCIPIDPFYLSWKSEKTLGPATLLDQAGKINKNMPAYVTNKVVMALNNMNKCMKDSNILVLGVSYKKDVSITHYSPSLDIIENMMDMGANVQYHDPFVPEYKIRGNELQSIDFSYERLSDFDCVVIVVDHSEYDWSQVVKNSQSIVDTRNATESVIDKSKITKG